MFNNLVHRLAISSEFEVILSNIKASDRYRMHKKVFHHPVYCYVHRYFNKQHSSVEEVLRADAALKKAKVYCLKDLLNHK